MDVLTIILKTNRSTAVLSLVATWLLITMLVELNGQALGLIGWGALGFGFLLSEVKP